MGVRLLFVCSGNICRSPMAEAMARAWAPGLGLQVEARSAGTLQLVDRPAARGMIAVGRELDLDLAAHRSQGLGPDLLRWADRVLAMERAHLLEIRQMAPDLPVEAATLLGPYAGRLEIDDPIGAWTLGPYRAARDVLREAVLGLLHELSAER